MPYPWGIPCRARTRLGQPLQSKSSTGRVKLSPMRSQENRFNFKKEKKNDNKRKSLSTGLERSWLALEGWQGLFRRRLLPQRTDGSGSRPDEGGLRNHLRYPQRQHATSGCAFRSRRFLRRGRGQAAGLYAI